MKKIFIVTIAQLFMMCSSTSNSTFQTRDDFASASENYINSFLKSKNAFEKNKSVIILTQGFKGEKITATQNSKTIYSQYPITNLKRQYAASFAFDNQSLITIFDNFTKEEIVIEPKDASKHKYIYVMKKHEDNKSVFKVTLSNTLRSLK
ncbi:MAG: hypothetical protein KYX68_12260 [Flavobacterium sp.]|nr:hypothetical protein [Flavobacterium sp.]